MQTTEKTPCPPWWRHAHVWLLIAGPAAVIVAGVATVLLALRTPDPVVAEDYYRRGIEINKTIAGYGKLKPDPMPMDKIAQNKKAAANLVDKVGFDN